MNMLKTETIIYDKAYDYESLYDLGEDIEDALSEDHNKIVKQLPSDEYGFIKGTFRVVMTWIPEETQ